MVNRPKPSPKLPNLGRSNCCWKRLSAAAITSLVGRSVGGVIWLSIHVRRRKIGPVVARISPKETRIKNVGHEAGKSHYLPTVVGDH